MWGARCFYLAATSAIALGFADQSWAQGSPEGESVEAIVVTGVRGRPRTVTDSPVPIDVVSADDIAAVPQTNSQDLLKTLIPSFSLNRQSNTTTNSFVRPVTLRGLSGDKTLVLVNSKRRHKSAQVSYGGNPAQAADIATIPTLALKSVEVLRDGAAAQYGSDAIAGVINFILKDDSDGAELTAQGGRHYEGDGANILLAGNIGMPLTDRGFANLSVQYNKVQATVRSGQFVNPQFDALLFAQQNPSYAAATDLSKPVQPFGQPKEESIRGFINAGFDVTENTELYAFGNYSWSTSTARGSYRFPGNGHTVLDNPIRLETGRIFRYLEQWPAGYSPYYSGIQNDFSAVFGYRGLLPLSGGRELSFDLSAREGQNHIVYDLVGTINASIGPDSPRQFKPVDFTSKEFSLNADFSYLIPTSIFAEPLTISAGGEFRRETFVVRPGDVDSYRAGPFSSPDPFGFCNPVTRTLNSTAPQNAGINCANYLSSTADGFPGLDPVYNFLTVGSVGVNGIPPSASGSFSRNSYAFYSEVATDILPGWNVALAARYEHFNDFGSTTNVKAATRFELTDWLAARGSVGTGFKAPTPGQLNITSAQTRTVNGVFTLSGLFPATNPVSRFLGAEPVGPEKSVNFSAGVTASPIPGLTLTIDAYHIKLTDQVYAISDIQVTPAIRAQMLAANVLGADGISSLNFFQNGFNSTTRGLDVVGTYRLRWNENNSTQLVASFNYNEYKVDKLLKPNLFNSTTIFNFENSSPQWRGVFSATHQIGAFTLLARANVYGPYEAEQNVTGLPRQKFHTEALIDFELAYDLADGYVIAVGARNVFDNYPQRDELTTNRHILYRGDSEVDWQGGYYYARMMFKL